MVATRFHPLQESLIEGLNLIPLPDTVTFTSNRQGHQIFVIPNRVKGGIRAVDVQQCQHIFAEAGDEVIADYLTLDEALEVAKGGVR